MFIVTVAPIKRGIPVDELSYFCKEELPLGALVSVPLRGKSSPALVIRSVSATHMKADIKHSSFALKKLERVHAKTFFPPAFVTAAQETARYFSASTGAVIKTLFPSPLLTSKKIASPPFHSSNPVRRGERFILQCEEKERLATYKSHIREVFARGGSCYFILPSVQDIEHVYGSLEKGIQEYTFILHGGLSKKTLEERWKKIVEMEHPVLVIGTPFFLALPRHDIECIILDRESSNAYNLLGRPFLDLRHFAEAFAKAKGAELILGDLFLRAETLYRKDAGEFEALLRPKYRLPSTAIQTLIDMRTSKEQPAAGRVAICSAELVDHIEAARKKGTNCFILGVRRGYAPMTVCGDCGTVVSCSRCSAPLVLHKKTGEAAVKGQDVAHHKSTSIFPRANSKENWSQTNEPQFLSLCHRCGNETAPEHTCTYCGGWKLTPLGIGITQAEDALRKRFPDAVILRIDRDSTPKHAQALERITKFYQTPGSILLGTEMAIPYLTEPVGTVAVLSVNSLLTIPDFRMGERVFRLLLALREKARDHFLIQTRDPDLPLFALAMQGNIGEFLREELDARLKLNYPPFSTLIKFTYEGKKAEGRAAMAEIEKIFGTYHPVTFPSFIARVKGKYLMNALIKIPKGDGKEPGWPDDELLTLMRALPGEVQVRVNPESVI